MQFQPAAHSTTLFIQFLLFTLVLLLVVSISVACVDQEQQVKQSNGTNPVEHQNMSTLLLNNALRNQKWVEIKRLIEEGAADVNSVDEDGTPLLNLAVMNMNVEMVKYLLKRGANLEAKTNESWRPLHLAAMYCSAEIVAILLAEGADISKSSDNGNTALQFAARCHDRSLAIVRTLLAHSLEKLGERGKVAFVNARNRWGWTALHQAAYSAGRKSLVKLLEDNGADGSIENDEGKAHWELNRDVVFLQKRN